jgi:NAD(P)-dependent dehydrogenase (short-subunit alcohol dehydrogenase family)
MPEEKTAFITGGTGGLGGAVTRAFVEAGYRVATTYIVPREWESLGELRERVLGLEVDVMDSAAVEVALERAEAELGSVRALVNLVGGFGMGKLAETSEEDWDRMLNLNLKTNFLVTRATLSRMPDGGRIVNVGTASVVRRSPGVASYVASKGGLMALTRSLANELKERRIAVNAVLPTVIDTPANREAMPNADRSSWLLPREVAEVILWLADNEGGIVTGNLVELGR